MPFDPHERNMETLEVAHMLNHGATLCIEMIDTKLQDHPGDAQVTVLAEGLANIRLVLSAQQDAIAKLVERDLMIMDSLVNAIGKNDPK